MANINIFTIESIVREAAKLFADRNAAHSTREKGACDYVTQVDESVQNFIRTELGNLYPDIQFLGEEQDNSMVDLSAPLWALDPVDGTTNLIHDYRRSAISLALLENGEPVMGIIYDPYLDEMFTAEKGKGSFLNGQPIHVSSAQTMADSLIAIGTSPYLKDEAPANFRMFERIFTACQDIRRSGSAAIDLASIAAGRIDGFLEKYLHIWDYAAGTLLIREAGGAVLEYDGTDFTMKMVGCVIAGTKPVAKILADEYAIR